MKTLQDYALKALSDFLAPHEPVSILTSDYWTSENGLTVASTLVAAVLGAVFGTVGTALISRWIAKGTAADQLRRDDKARRERDKAIALETFVKATTITNQLYSLLGLALSMLNDAKKQGAHEFALWQRILPMAGVTKEPERFSAQEAAILIAAREFDIAKDLFLLAEKYASLTDSIHRYTERRLRLTDSLSLEIAGGGLGQIKLTKEQYDRHAGQMYELEDMAAQICAAMVEDFEFAKATTLKIGPAFRATLEDDEFPLIVFPAGGEQRCAEFRSFFPGK
ncbi:hypothetical protein [Rhizobium johnstonii]|uniref:hypothetical protein n=1 Tax=Rhizobium johnstonii TaxID=3019933 RepID=UPI003F9D0E28